MRKILAVLFILLFTAGDAFANIEVRYNNAGARRSIQYGAHAPRSAANFGRNAAFSYSNRRAAGIRQRRFARDRALIRALANYNSGCGGYGGYGSGAYTQDVTTPSVRAVEPSRFNRNYKVSTAKKTYTRGGVTYYN